jgi:hypothetical protein
MPGNSKEEVCKMFDQNQWCDFFSRKDGDGWYCIGKPVIYLYPTKPTYVDVTVETEGNIFISDPVYPTGGWKNVLAQPDGTLLYQDKTFRELFYESQTPKLKRPEKGIVMETKNLKQGLLQFISGLGLTKKDEQDEFLDWWIPRLNALHSPYIFVSILDNDEKKRVDKVDITPKPDTFIDFVVYFAPRQTNENSNELVLPPAPARRGFTAIEWGGVIGD